MIVKELRLKAGLTQSQLAEKVGTDRSTVTKWELGESFPRASMIPALAAALNCSVADLFGESKGSVSGKRKNRATACDAKRAGRGAK